MAMMNAIFFGIVNNRRRPRGPNVNRMSCQSAENSQLYTRLGRQDVNALALEYKRWRSQADGVTMTYHNSLKRMEVFLQYLAKGGYYHQIGRTEGIAESTAMAYLHSVATFFQHTTAQ